VGQGLKNFSLELSERVWHSYSIFELTNIRKLRSYARQGFKTGTCVLEKSLALRETTVRL
jgi:hypothetical protein